jgi:hypothetical protein
MPNAPVTLRIAVWLLAAESVALGLFALVLVVGDLRGGVKSQQGAAGVIAFLLVICVVLGVASRALHGRRSWARGPAIVLHMFLLPLGIAMATGGQPLLGVVALLLGAVGTVVLLAPGTRIAVGRD